MSDPAYNHSKLTESRTKHLRAPLAGRLVPERSPGLGLLGSHGPHSIRRLFEAQCPAFGCRAGASAKQHRLRPIPRVNRPPAPTRTGLTVRSGWRRRCRGKRHTLLGVGNSEKVRPGLAPRNSGQGGVKAGRCRSGAQICPVVDERKREVQRQVIRLRARGEYIGSVSAVDQASALNDPIREFQLDGSEAIRLLVCPGEKSTEPSKCRPCVFLSRLETEMRSTAPHSVSRYTAFARNPHARERRAPKSRANDSDIARSRLPNKRGSRKRQLQHPEHGGREVGISRGSYTSM